ncbi:MAG: SpoIID/LytB domain-containing protein [Lachnospiraceae bacterium]|nr:SpoIID/LytB domain-containing protein [Lachnospiraceae bacterium]
MMKKMIFFIVVMIMVPIVLTLGFSVFSDKITFGQGGNSLENRLMGREVLIEINGLYKSLDVEEYVLGVMSGTIPADYDVEALKVQAILIRTNVLKELQEKNTSDAADLSYQYLTVEDRITLWGDKHYEKYESLFERAVAETAGLVIEQEKSLIMALYHEVSIGKTASASEILDEDIFYLQSVESSRDVEAKHYMNLVTYTWEEIGKLAAGSLESQAPEQAAEASVEPTGEDSQGVSTDTGKIPLSIVESTENGFVKAFSVNGVVLTGQEAMERFGLSSTNFYVEEIEGGVRFVCLGKGSCLGVSQYGANCMALEGKTSEEIIRYYYQNVSLVQYGAYNN